MKRIILITILAGLMLCGCRRSQTEGTNRISFIPPTLVATAVNTPTVSPITPAPVMKIINCTKSLTYIDDVTVPDGSIFAPGATIVKTWKVKNSGTCEWSGRYSLRYEDGNLLGADRKQELPAIAPTNDGNITITFTAPDYMGSFYSGWMAYDDQGNPFGDMIYMEIIVDPYSAGANTGQ